MSGAVTAIEADDKNASVMILEKQDAAAHCTNSSMYGFRKDGCRERLARLGGKYL